jgi:(p)ppGpp synthase/HD superfamily hydrolase
MQTALVALSGRFDEALVYAARVHRGQLKAGGAPYVAHLLAVAAIVLQYGGSEDEAIAALLHDAAEDHGGLPRLEDIRARFGDAVAAIVLGCTDDLAAPKPPWRARKEAHLAHLALASPGIVLVSAADKLDNLRTLIRDYRLEGEAIWARRKAGRDARLWYCRALADALRASGHAPALVAEVGRKVGELERLVQGCARA